MGETATGTVERTVDPGGVVDTDILVDALRRVPAAVTFLRDAERYLTVAAITQMELLQGCRNLAELRRVEQFLRRFAVRSLSELIGGIGTSLMRRYRLSHGLLLPDALIAATAIEYDVTLYAKNVLSYLLLLPCAACIASHSFGAVYGISIWSMPRGASASITALATAGGAPLQPASPTPLTPSGWNGFGVTVSPRMSGGISLARGTA